MNYPHPIFTKAKSLSSTHFHPYLMSDLVLSAIRTRWKDGEIMLNACSLRLVNLYSVPGYEFFFRSVAYSSTYNNECGCMLV